MNTINLGLNNEKLYAGCEITEVGGRQTLATPPTDASNIIGRNCAQIQIIESIPAEQRGELVLTGPMAVWAYLIIFHQVVHKFGHIYYDDGRGNKILVAQH
jgi:hypothetical protein